MHMDETWTWQDLSLLKDMCRVANTHTHTHTNWQPFPKCTHKLGCALVLVKRSAYIFMSIYNGPNTMRYDVVIADTTKWLMFLFQISNFCWWLQTCCVYAFEFRWNEAIDRWTLMASINMNMHQFFEPTWTWLTALYDKTEFELTPSWLKLCSKFCLIVLRLVWKFSATKWNLKDNFVRILNEISMAATVCFYWFIWKTFWKVCQPREFGLVVIIL